MGALEILEQWLEPITRPLEDFLSETQILATTHQESVKTFNTLVQDLTDTNDADAFVGDAADSFVELTGEYLTSETALSGTVGALAGPLAEAGSACAKAVTDIGGAVAGVAVTAPDVEALGEATAVVDASAVIQGGVDVPDDVVAGGLTLTTAAVVLNILMALALAIAYIIFLWRQTMNLISGSPMPRLPKTPTVTPPQMSLSPAQQKVADDLEKEFGGEFSLAEIEQLIKDHPQWSRDRLRQELLRKLLSEGKGYLGQLVGKRISLGNGQYKTLTESDLEAMIRAGYTYTMFAVILGLAPLSAATTPEGRQLTWHALVDAIPRHGITLQEIDAVIDNPSRTSTQADGGTAYIKSTKQGYELVIVSSTGEIVTALEGLKPGQLKQLGQNYGFNPNP